MIATQNKTYGLYEYKNGIGATTEATLTRLLRHILYGDLYDDGDGNIVPLHIVTGKQIGRAHV